jgi:hypothetical protein
MEQNNALIEAQISNTSLSGDNKFEEERWFKGKNKRTKHIYLRAVKTFCEYSLTN